MTYNVRAARPGERAEVSGMLGRAFQVEPVYEWLWPETALRQRRLGPLIDVLIHRLHPGQIDVAMADGRIGGAAVWDPPGTVEASSSATLRALPSLLRLTRLRLPKLAILGGKLDEARPKEPHWYLFHLGADPERQGSGVGSALLRHGLARCDEQAAPAYLECKPDLVSYYGRFGFEPRHEVVIDATLSSQGLWREAR